VSDYLLDTHTAIWFLDKVDNLSQTAKQVILDPSNRKYISSASVWELSIKISAGKLKFSGGNSAGFVNLAKRNDFFIIPVKLGYYTVLEGLPLIHRDPFDRIIIATAIAEQMTIITTDADIVRYDVPHVW
jgi:PIN domain nuclease of toxin-antitoxin system